MWEFGDLPSLQDVVTLVVFFQLAVTQSVLFHVWRYCRLNPSQILSMKSRNLNQKLKNQGYTNNQTQTTNLDITNLQINKHL